MRTTRSRVDYAVRFCIALSYFAFSLTTSTLILFYASLFGDDNSFTKRVRAVFAVLTCAPWLLCFGVRLAVEDESRVFAEDGQVKNVNIGSHASHIDGLAMMVVYWRNRHRCFPPSAIVKREVLFTPFYGLFAFFAGNVLVSRGSSKTDAIESMDRVGQKLKSGYVVGAFPEGSRRREPSRGKAHLMRFKKGVFHMIHDVILKNVKVNISPFCLIGSRTAWPSGRLIPTSGSKILLKFCDPIEALPSQTPDELCERTKASIEKGIEESSTSPTGIYDIDVAFGRGVEINLKSEFLLNSILLCLPSLLTVGLGVVGLL